MGIQGIHPEKHRKGKKGNEEKTETNGRSR